MTGSLQWQSRRVTQTRPGTLSDQHQKHGWIFYGARMTSRRVEISRSPDDAWVSLLTAAADVGKVKEQQEATRSLTMKARYGLNFVSLRCSVLSGAAAGTAVIEFEARGQDIRGVASRLVIDRVIARLA